VVAAVLYAANTTINPVPDPSTPTGAASYNQDLAQFLRQEDSARQGELPLFPEGVLAQNGGGLHGVSASMTSLPFATKGYTSLGNRVVQTNASINYSAQTCPASATAWVVASAQPISPLGTFLRVPGTAYYTDCTSGAMQPTLPPDSFWLMKVTIAGSQITAVQDLGTRSIAQEGTVLDASRYPGTTLGQKVRAAIATLPAQGGTVDARRLFLSSTTPLTLDVNLFADVAADTPVTVQFGPGSVTQTVTQNLPSFATVHCDTQGGIALGSTGPFGAQGTKFTWNGATTQTMWNLTDTTQVGLYNCVFDAANVTDVTPLRLDSTNHPQSSLHVLSGLTLLNFTARGINWGGTTATPNAVNSHVRIERLHMVANNPAAVGIKIDSTAATNATLDQIVVQQTNIGIWLAQAAGRLDINQMTCQSLSGTLAICILAVSPEGLSIRNSAHEASGGTDARSITLEGAPSNQQCTIIENFFLGRAIHVLNGGQLCVITRGLHGPSQAIVDSGARPRIVSMGDTFPWGNIATVPTQNAYTGWLTTTGAQITRIGQMTTGPNGNQFPMTLETDTNLTQVQLNVVNSAVSGLAGIGLVNLATGGRGWAMQSSTANTGGWQLNNITNATFPFIVAGNAPSNALVLSNEGIRFMTMTAGVGLGVSATPGSAFYCSDCGPTNISTCSNSNQAACVCAGGGTGAFARRVGSAWYCN